MTSGFHPNELNPQLSNYPVSKGDVEGHEFHGNQYTVAQSSAKSLETSARHMAKGMLTHDEIVATLRHAIDAHGALANHHNGESEKYFRSGWNRSGTAHLQAEKAHADAYQAAKRALNKIESRRGIDANDSAGNSLEEYAGWASAARAATDAATSVGVSR